METVKLKDMDVSRLCFGSLTMAPLQRNLSIEEGAELIAYSFEKGINFIDTAELYGTYPYIRQAKKKIGEKLIVSTKCYAYDTAGAMESVEKARREMDVDVIDVFMMHEQESVLTLEGHREALEYYLEQREKGIIKAVGVSTHFIEVVNACADMPEIDIIHPIVNAKGLGIVDGSIQEMLAAIEKASKNGKFILGMKPLGGGNLINKAVSYYECMKFVLENPYIDSVALGMQTLAEIDMNVAMFEGREIPMELERECASRKKSLHVAYWCEGCGNCQRRCKIGAIQVKDNKAVVDEDKCVICGYCSEACPGFALKIY